MIMCEPGIKDSIDVDELIRGYDGEMVPLAASGRYGPAGPRAQCVVGAEALPSFKLNCAGEYEWLAK